MPRRCWRMRWLPRWRRTGSWRRRPASFARQYGAGSVRVVVLSRVKVVGGGFHLVLKDAVGGSARCIADGEHAPDANIDPDGIRLAARRSRGPAGSSGGWSVACASCSRWPPSAICGHLARQGSRLPRGVSRQPEPRSGAPACTLTVPPAGRAGQAVTAGGGTAHASRAGAPGGSAHLPRPDSRLICLPSCLGGGGTASAAAVSYCLLVVRYRVLITGQVQGVNFRAACRRMALQHGVRGWVRNLPGGSVEAAFEGPADDVRQLLDWTRRGPQLAVVAGVAVQAEQPEGLDTFLIRY